MSEVLILGPNGMLAEAFIRRLSIRGVSTITSSVDVSDTMDVIDVVSQYRPSHIINCAAFTAVDEAERRDKKNKVWEANVQGPMNCAIAASLYDAKAIHFSTDYVFDGSRLLYTENDETNPINEYGKSKLEGENRFLKIHPEGLVVRTSWLFSEFRSNFVKVMLVLMNCEEDVKVVSDQIGRPTYAPWLADIVCQLVLDGQPPSGILHLANSGATSWYEFAVAIRERAIELGLLKSRCVLNAVSSSELNYRAKRPQNSVLDTTRVEELLGAGLKPWNQALLECLQNIQRLEEEDESYKRYVH